MAQHHRLSPLARDLTLAMVGSMSEAQICTYFSILRWDSETQQVCPKCGTLDRHYPRRQRRRHTRRPCSSWETPTNPTWQCKHCQGLFSLTSGTLFDSTKLSLRAILNAALIFLAPGNGAGAVGVSGLTGLSFKTVFLLQQRFREAMAEDQPSEPFDGLVQMDGGYFCGKPRKPNRKTRRVTQAQLRRRYGKDQIDPDEAKPWEAMGMTYRNWKKMANKRVVLAVTCSSGNRGDGARDVAVGVARGGESEYAVHLMASAHITPGALVMTDEAGAYKQLERKYEHHAVCHAREFSTAEGVNDNHCETFIGRMRRAEYGIYNGSRPLFLHFYACEAAWRHRHRRRPKSEQVRRLLSTAMSMQPSTRLRGYYAGKGHRVEVLID